MRVAVNVEQLLYRAPGGIGRYSARLVRALGGAFPDDTIVPFTARHRADDVAQAFRAFELSDADLARWVGLPLPRRVLYDSWNALNGPSLGRPSPELASVDLVHAPMVAVPPRRSGPLVVTVHDAAPALFPEAFPRHGRWFHQRGLKAAAERADLVIAVSEAAAAELAEHTPIPAERIRVVLNGVDHVHATGDAVDNTRQRLDLDDAPYVLWVGSLEPRKNVGVLAEAFARVVAGGGISHRLVLVGPTGWLSEGLIAPSVQSKLGWRLRQLGPRGDGELRALYAGADLFCFPSRHEGFGLPVLEAMVQGTPVICAGIPVLREVAGSAARFVAPDDVDGWAEAISQLLHDDEECRRLAEAGRVRAGEFTWERTARATRAVYVEALGQDR